MPSLFRLFGYVIFFWSNEGAPVVISINKKTAPSPSLKLFFMPVVGVEPTRVIRTRDFESPSSAIPTHRHGKITKLLYRILSVKSR